MSTYSYTSIYIILLRYKVGVFFSSFLLLLAFVVGGLGFEFCVSVAGWRHALRSEWPFIIIIIIKLDGLVALGCILELLMDPSCVNLLVHSS